MFEGRIFIEFLVVLHVVDHVPSAIHDFKYGQLTRSPQERIAL
jgi:hypothetical protein